MKTIEELERTIEAGRLEDGRMQRKIFELEAENLRVRGLLQRILKLRGMRLGAQMSWDEIAAVCAESADIGKLERPVPAMTNLERRALEILSSLKAHAGRTHPGDGNPIDSLCPDHNVAIEKLIEDLQDEALKE